MSESSRVLVVVDPTATQQPAAERAAWFAKKMNASLDLLICDYDQHLSTQEVFDPVLLEKTRVDLLGRYEKRLEELAERFRADGLDVSVSARWDTPLHEGILRQIEALKPAMVVKDTHYHSAIRRAIFSNTDWNLIRKCPVPLLLVKPIDYGKKVKIIAAVDPTHAADKSANMDRIILAAAENIRAVSDGELHVVHAVNDTAAYIMAAEPLGMPLVAPTKELVESLRIQHEKSVDKLLNESTVARENIHVVSGDPREVLVAQAEALYADIVVLGAVARGAIDRLLLGSTAERVLDHLPCDLLIVKAPK